MRCFNYALKSVGELEVRRVAGRIVPAVATTTAFVCGLVCLELLKVAGEQKALKRINLVDGLDEEEKERLSDRFRNSFTNLALPMVAFTQPVPAEVFSLPLIQKEEQNRNHMFRGQKKTATEEELPPSIKSYTMWDVIEAPLTVHTETVLNLQDYFARKHQVVLESLTWNDLTLYADYLSPTQKDLETSIGGLINGILTNDNDGDFVDEDEDGKDDEFYDDRDNSDAQLKALKDNFDIAKQGGFIDLEASGKIVEGLEEIVGISQNFENENGIRIPPIRVWFDGRKPPLTDVSKRPRRATAAKADGNEQDSDDDGKLRKRDKLRKLGAGISSKFRRRFSKQE